jgi:hypothetical protein
MAKFFWNWRPEQPTGSGRFERRLLAEAQELPLITGTD